MRTGDYAEPNRELVGKIERLIADKRIGKYLHNLNVTGLWDGPQGLKNLELLHAHKSAAYVVAALHALQVHNFLGEGSDNAKTQQLFKRIIQVEDAKELTKILHVLSVNNLLSKEHGTQFLDKIFDRLNRFENTSRLYRWTKSFFDWATGEKTTEPLILSLSTVLRVMSEVHLLEGRDVAKIFDRLMQHPNLGALSLALENMYKGELLDDTDKYANFDALLIQKDIASTALGLSLLEKAGMLKGAQGQKCFEVFIKHPNTRGLVEAIIRAEDAGLLKGADSRQRFYQLVRHPHPISVAAAIKVMQPAGLLSGKYTDTNFNTLMMCDDLFDRVLLMKQLNAESFFLSGTVRQMNFENIMSVKHPKQLLQAVSALSSAGFFAGPSAQTVLELVFEYHKELPNLGEILQIMSRAGLLSGSDGMQNLQNLLANQNPNALFNVVKLLDTLSLLKPTHAASNYKLVLQHQALDVLELALKQMARAGLLDGAHALGNLHTAMAHRELRYTSWTLHDLNQAGLLGGSQSQPIFNALMTNTNPKRVSSIVRSLLEAGVLQGKTGLQYLEKALMHNAPQHLSFILSTMREVGLLKKDNADTEALVEHIFAQDPKDLAEVAWALKQVHNLGLLSGDKARANAVMLELNQRPTSVLKGLRLMENAGLLSGEHMQRNFDSLVRSTKVDSISWLLGIFDKSDMLPEGPVSQRRFEELVSYLTRLLNRQDKQDEARILNAAMESGKSFDLRVILQDPHYFHDDLDLDFVMGAFVRYLVTEKPAALTKEAMQDMVNSGKTTPADDLSENPDDNQSDVSLGKSG